MIKNSFIIFTFLVIASCGSSNDDTPVQENRNPGTFSISTSSITENSAVLDWTISTDPDGDTVTYEVKVDGNTVSNNLSQTTFTLTNLNSDTQYNGTVIAKDGNGGTVSSSYNLKTLEDQSNATISFNIPNELADYYSSMTFYEDSQLLKDELAGHIISKHSTFLEYGQRHNYLYDADEDATNTAYVILMYNGESRDEREYQSGNNSHSPQTFNTEHVYPQSLINNTARGDLHHLRSCDISINSSRENFPFADGSGTYKLINGDSWYPGDEWRGDVARMIMYLNLRYDESFNDVGNMDLFLKWNADDPISDFERQRNNVIEGAQGNRNPFIDNPYLATLIWGGNSAENLWQ